MNMKHGLQAAALALALAGSALAATPASSAKAVDTELEEVTITAERREVSVQNLPISAIALSATTLDERGVKTFEELQYQVPSLTFTDNGNTKFVNIRGIGVSESAPNQTVGVAVHMDGAYIAREFVFGDSFFDLQDVEVLRGPQGTYSGQNASGGAIFINSKRPVIGKTDGFASVDFGNYGERRFGAGSTFTLSDTLAVRVAAETETRDSYYRNHGVDPAADPATIEDQPGNLNRSLGRVQLLYKPNDKLQFRLIHELSDVRTDGVPYKIFPAIASNQLPTTGLWDLNYDIDGHRNVTYNRTTGIMEWAATDSFKVLANLSTLSSRQHYLQDGDRGSPLAPALSNPPGRQSGSDYTIKDHYYTAEVNLVSTGDGPLEWTVGASRLDYEQKNYLNFLRYNTTAPYTQTVLDLARDTNLYLFLDDIRINNAAFGEIGYHLNQQFEVKAGLRYNKDKVGFDPSSYQAGIPQFPTPVAGRLSFYNSPDGYRANAPLLDFSATTGRVLVNWTPNDHTLVYGTISRGYKPGGTTPLAATYLSETVTNYEVGWKANLFGRHLMTSISAYHMAYNNFQRTYNPNLPGTGSPTQQITYNVSGSTIQGLEAQLSGEVADLNWDVSLSYADGKYGDLSVVLPTGIIDGVNPTAANPTKINLKGQSIDYLPKISWGAGLAYRGWRTAGGRFVPSVRVQHQGEYYTTFYHYAFNLTPAKTLVDVSFAYEAEKNWRLELYAKNAGDKTYISRAQGGSSPIGTYLLGAPRTVGVKLNYRF